MNVGLLSGVKNPNPILEPVMISTGSVPLIVKVLFSPGTRGSGRIVTLNVVTFAEHGIKVYEVDVEWN